MRGDAKKAMNCNPAKLAVLTGEVQGQLETATGIMGKATWSRKELGKK